MRSRSIAAGLLLVVAVAGCSSKPIARAGHTTVVDETIAPQSPATSEVSLTIIPARSGSVRVITSKTGSAPAWTAAHVWLDRRTGGRWEAAWLLDLDGHSLAIDDFRSGGTPLSAVGVRAPGTLVLTLSPKPPSGHYRVRLAVYSRAPESQTGQTPTWAIGTIDIT